MAGEPPLDVVVLLLRHFRYGILSVTIQKGNDLMAKDSGGTSDPYVVVALDSQEPSDTHEEQKTWVCKNTLNPIWGAQFRFVLSNARMRGILPFMPQ